MTKDKLLERQAKLVTERDQLISNINAYNGALQEVAYWLAQVEKEEADAKSC